MVALASVTETTDASASDKYHDLDCYATSKGQPIQPMESSSCTSFQRKYPSVVVVEVLAGYWRLSSVVGRYRQHDLGSQVLQTCRDHSLEEFIGG